jgi:hypothetical protein
VKKLGWAAAMATVTLVGLCVSSPAASASGPEFGEYVVLDGPFAGVNFGFETRPSPSVNSHTLGIAAHGRVESPNGKCAYLHFRGAINGHRAPRKAPCWRVIARRDLSDLFIELNFGMEWEWTALYNLTTRSHHGSGIFAAEHNLEAAHDKLSTVYDEIAALQPPVLAEALRTKLEELLAHAANDDRAAIADLHVISEGEEKKAIGLIETAIKAKQQVVKELPLSLVEKPAPKGPAAPVPETFGAPDLTPTPAPLLGGFSADVEYWPMAVAHAFGARAHTSSVVASATAPADGMVTSITVKGYAIKGDMPGPGGSEPIRFTVARPQPNGQLQVITTTNPPFTLPGTSGTYTFPMSQVSFACCRVKKGDYVSLDARGGEFAVFASVPGAVTDDFSMAGLTQNAGFMWTGTPHEGVELLMQVTEQPSK